MSWDCRPAPTRNKLNPSSSQTDTCLSVLPSLLFIYFAGWLFLTKQRLGSSLACPSAPRSTSERGRRLVPLQRRQLGPRAWVTCSKNVSAPARAAGGCPEILPKAAGTRGLSQARPGPVLRSPRPRVAPPRLGSGRGRVRRPGRLQRAVSLRELPGGALRLRLQSAAPSTGGRVRKTMARPYGKTDLGHPQPAETRPGNHLLKYSKPPRTSQRVKYAPPTSHTGCLASSHLPSSFPTPTASREGTRSLFGLRRYVSVTLLTWENALCPALNSHL
ncbi:uncharacterized protein LOC123596852 [Leopardus geoffroyi]|uniref:uncharacterized protein LOC123596852 n=1 Tax=Leopardus geoffroyi TaxID=46844 RepID=UPI001E2633D0|nr:uncharacterized protein LOC123596852 [Leopardus geoffroyi]